MTEAPGDHIGLQAAHAPDHNGNHDLVQQITTNERQIFDYLLRPNDIYNPQGTYWADLPLLQRFKFVYNFDKAETKREFGNFLKMFKKDPLSPIGWYLRNAVIPGAGLGLEGYILFSIGNLKSLFGAPGSYPDCWKSRTVCNPNWVAAVDYLEIIGIMFGQISVGALGDWLGRRWGLIQDASIMLLGLIMLTAVWGTDLNGWVIAYAWSLFTYAVGVGGEYPMTATTAMESASRSSPQEDRLHRGRRIVSAFLMQGWGQMSNQVILAVLLIIFNSGTGDAPYLQSAVQFTYRLSFAIPAVVALWLVYYRTYKMTVSRQLQLVKKKSNVTGYDIQSLKLTFKYFGFRVVATAGGWFCNDVFFYGNKLFQGEFITTINGGVPPSSVMPNWTYNLINISVSLVGYYLASFFIDNKLYGRKMMQQIGFMVCAITFIIPAFNLPYYISTAGVQRFQAMYFVSSFFTQFGSNAVTFLVAAEVYPTPVRASAHGFSAACGKSGALLAAVLYNYISVQTRFYFIPWFCLTGMLLTFFFLPDTTGLDLKEQERRWHFIRTGRESEYHGIAIHPQHLSLWERWRGVGKNYNADLDYKQKIEELRGEWEEEQNEKLEVERRGRHEIDTAAALDDSSHDSIWTDDVHSYYQSTRSPVVPAKEKQLGEKNTSPQNSV